MGAREAYTMNQ